MAPKSRPKDRQGRLSGTKSPSSLDYVTASSAIYHSQSGDLAHNNPEKKGKISNLNLAHNNPENKGKISNLGGIEALLKAIKDHPTVPEVQKRACAALFNLSLVAENKVKISKLGAKESVRRAMAAANATEVTKEWGQELLNRLAQC